MVRNKKRSNPFIDFALNYRSRYSTLSAGAAIARCKALLQDLEKFEDRLWSTEDDANNLELGAKGGRSGKLSAVGTAEI